MAAGPVLGMRARLGLSERSWLFLLSLIIALTMWLYVTVVLNPQHDRLVRNVEVTFNGLRDGWKAVADPRVVDVELRGPASILKVRATDVRAIADVATLEAGSHRVTLRVQVPSGAGQASPSAVQVAVTRP